MLISMAVALLISVAIGGYVLHAAWLSRAMPHDGDGREQDVLALLTPIETAIRIATTRVLARRRRS